MLMISALVKDIDSPMGKYLICRCGGGKWTLPSGYVHANEDAQDAVKRIAAERLGFEVVPGKLQMRARGPLSGETVSREYYDAVRKFGGEPSAEGCEFRWVRPEGLREFEFEDSDARFMSKFIPWICSDGSEIPGTKML